MNRLLFALCFLEVTTSAQVPPFLRQFGTTNDPVTLTNIIKSLSKTAVSGNTFSNVVLINPSSSNYQGNAQSLTNTMGTNIAIASQMGAHGDAVILNDGDNIFQATGGTDDTRLLQSILDSATNHLGFELYVDVPCVVTGLVIYPNTTIRCSGRGGLYLRDNSNQPIVRNAFPSTGTITNGNIKLIGGFYFGDGLQQTAGSPGPGNGDGYVNAVGFYGITNLTIEDLIVRDSAEYFFALSNWKNVILDRITIQTIVSGADGIHMFSGDGAKISNINGNSVSDFIALNSSDYHAGEVATWVIRDGDIKHVLIDGVNLQSTFEGISMLACKNVVDDITIRNVTGKAESHGIRMWNFWGPATGTGGFIGNVLLDGMDFDGNISGNQFPPIAFLNYSNNPVRIKNLQIKNVRLRFLLGSCFIGSDKAAHGSNVIDQLQISGVSMLETNATPGAKSFWQNYDYVTNATINDLMWIRQTNSANSDWIVRNEAVGVINSLGLGVMTLSTNIAATITNAGVILSTNAPFLFNGGPSALVATDAGDQRGVKMKTLAIGSGLSSDGTTLTANAGSGTASNALTQVFTNGVSVGAVTTSNLNFNGSSGIIWTGAVHSGQADVGIELIAPNIGNATATSLTNNAVGSNAVVVTDGNGKEIGATLKGLTLASGTLRYDPTDESYVNIDEEFLNNPVAPGTVGKYGWVFTAVASGTFSDTVDSTPDHPGLCTITTTASGGSGGDLVLGDAGASPAKGPLYGMQTRLPWKMRFSFMLSSTNGVQFEAGLRQTSDSDNTTNISSGAIGVLFDSSSADQNLQLVTGSTPSDLGLLQSGIWYDVLIQSVTSGKIFAQVNGGPFVTNTFTGWNGTMRPNAGRIALQGGGVGRTLTIDYWKFTQQQNTRYP